MPPPPFLDVALGLGSGWWLRQAAIALQVNASACCTGKWAGLLFGEAIDLHLGGDASVK